jgi:excisionase family DNA binding protein
MPPRAPAPSETRFLTPEEVAAHLRVSPAVVLRLLRRGELPALRVGRVWRVDEDEFRRWIRRRRTRASGFGRLGRRSGNGPGALCLCGCGNPVGAPGARFLPGHGGKLVHRLMTKEGMSFEAARETVRRMHRPRQQQRLF